MNDRYDNFSFYWADSLYNSARAKMEIHLKAIDPNGYSSFLQRFAAVNPRGINQGNAAKAGIIKGAAYTAYGLNKKISSSAKYKVK